MFFKENRQKKVLFDLLRETEDVVLKDIFNLHFFERTLSEILEYDESNQEKWSKEFFDLEGKLRELQGRRESINKMSGRDEFKIAEIDKIEQEKQPMINAIQPLHEKRQKIENYSKKIKECRSKLDEMRQYVLALKEYIRGL